MFLDMNYLNRTGSVMVYITQLLRPKCIYYQEQNKVERVIIVNSRQVGNLGIVFAVCLVVLNFLFGER